MVRIIVSEHDPHPFEWVVKGVKDADQNLWKYISLELPSFPHLVCCVVWKLRKHIFGKINR